ncbi:MAG: hypothetical protein WCR98_02035 [Saccharofermentanales bacterium]|jgi:hypothetical protein
MTLLAFAGAEDGMGEVSIAGSVIQSTSQKRSGSYSFRGPLTDHELENVLILNFSARSEVYFQGAHYTEDNSLFFGDKFLLCWRSGTTILGGLTINSDSLGYKVWTGDKATQIGSISAGYQQSNFILFELRVKLDDAVGVIQIKINGSQVFDFSGDTKSGTETTIDNVLFSNSAVYSPGSYFYWDDIIICDTFGPYMNSWPGGAKIEALRPTGAGAYSQWTPSSENNWECVDETPPSMTDYIESVTTGHKDSYVMEDIIADAISVKAVVSRYWGGGGGQIKSLLRIGSTDYVGSAIDVPISFSYADEIRYISPATSNPFTKSELNGLESGIEKV